jgi:hypothetical protein
METDFLIAGLMALASVAVVLVLLVQVARATREAPRQKAEGPGPQAQPAAGW